MATLRDVPHLHCRLADMLSRLCNVPAEHIRLDAPLRELGIRDHQRQDLHYMIERHFKCTLRRSIFDLHRVQDLALAIRDAPEKLPPMPQVLSVPPEKTAELVAAFAAPDPHARIIPAQVDNAVEEMLIWALLTAQPVLEHAARAKGPRAVRRRAIEALRQSRTTLAIAQANGPAVSSKEIVQHIGMLVALLDHRNGGSAIAGVSA